MSVTRRFLLTGAASAVLAAPFLARPLFANGAADKTAAPDPLRPLWDAWKSKHLTSDGRVVDIFQQSGSHSEGQGYAMCIAEALGDQDAFERIHAWTEANLAVRPNDSLFAWRWLPQDGGVVQDLNNASDGDLFIAWSLVRASNRFNRPDFLTRASEIAADLKSICIRPCPDRSECLVLMPGETGFETETGVIQNPAYYMYKALHELSDATEIPEFDQCASDGLALVSRLSRTELVPDWCEISPDGVGPAPMKSFDFGYEALRVPLFLVWSGLPGHPAVKRAAAAYAPYLQSGSKETPTVIQQDGTVSESSPDTGYRAVAALDTCGAGHFAPRMMPAFDPNQAYYPATLHLFALIAQREAQTACIK
ncbi:MAG: glycosyl hydrolase family 8 [Pseudomonadota bacterium]